MSRLLRATIAFLSASEGGRATPAMTGVRPQLKVGDVFTSTIVRSEDPEVDVFEPGRQYNVTLEMVFWDTYGQLVDLGGPVELFDGRRLIARGVFRR